MLKSGKLKLADDMIVTAQEAANKAETVFTIYDDTTETEIAKGPIGGGGGGGDTRTVKVLVKTNNVNVSFNPTYGKEEISYMGEVELPGPIYLSNYETIPNVTVNNNEYVEMEAPENGGILLDIDGFNNVSSVTCSENATTVVENRAYYFPSDGEINIVFSGVNN